MKIYAPVKDTNGVYASVRFVNGVGETDNPKLIEWFRNHGYGLVDKTEKSVFNPVAEVVNDQIDGVKNENDDFNSEANFDDMTPNELRDWMKANGYGLKIKNIRNKEKLLEILRG